MKLQRILAESDFSHGGSRGMRFFVFILFFLLFAVTSVFAAESRIALVVGIDSIRESDPNGGEANDARMFGEALRKQGFEVTFALNTDKVRTAEVVAAFSEAVARPDTVAAFYFAGRIFNRDGESLILPSDSDLSTISSLENSSVSLIPLATALRRGRQSQRLLFLDPSNPVTGLPRNWQNWFKIGFAPFSGAVETLVFESKSHKGELICGKQSAFVTAFLSRARRGGEIAEIAREVAVMLDIGGSEVLSPVVSDNRSPKFVLAPRSDVEVGGLKNFVELFYEFEKEARCACRRRVKALILGNELVTMQINDITNDPIRGFVKKKTALMAAAEPRCRLEGAYNHGFQNQNWPRFFAATDGLLRTVDESGLKVDILIDASSVAYDRVVAEGNREYEPMAVDYSRKTMTIIDANPNSMTGKWGVFLPVATKKSAIFRSHRILGEMLLPTDPGAALGHFRKAVAVFDVQAAMKRSIGGRNATESSLRPLAFDLEGSGGAVKSDEFRRIFIAVGEYYFNEALSLSNRHRRLSESPTGDDEIERTALAELAKLAAELSIDAFARGHAFTGDPKLAERLMSKYVATLNETVPELGGNNFTEPDPETTASLPIPEWKILKN